MWQSPQVLSQHWSEACVVWSKSSSTSVEEVRAGSNPFLACIVTCNYSCQCKTPNTSFFNLLFSLGVTFSCIQCAVILGFSLYSSQFLGIVPDHKYFWVEHLVLMCALEMLLSAIFHFSPKWYFSSCVCPEQLVSWSISEATKDPFENKDLKSHKSDFPELRVVVGEGVCSPAMHMGTLRGCLPPLSPYWLSPLLLPVSIIAEPTSACFFPGDPP